MRLLFGFFVMSSLFVAAQTGPGGVGNSTSNVLWLSADNAVFSDGGVTPVVDNDNVQQWNDRSGNGHSATSATLSQRPNYIAGVVNGLPVLRFTAANGDRILSTGVASGDAASVWAVASYSSLPTANPGIIHGAPAGSPFDGNGNMKTIGMWVSSGAGTRVWGRGVQSNSTIRDISQTQTLNAGVFYSILNRYDGSANINQYVNDNAAGSVAYNGTLGSWSDFGIGRQGSESWNGDIAEVIAFNTAVNTAQRIIIDNYLAAKYNLTLAVNDLYTMDDPGNGDFDFEVAGIGRANSTNIQNDAQGSGVVRVLNPTDLEDGEYFIWGHNGGLLQATNTTDIPSSVTARFDRIWRVSETGGDGNVGNIDVQFDLSSLPDFNSISNCDIALSIRLLVDTDNDGFFNDQTPITGATNVGGNIYRFANVGAIANGNRFTLAVTSSAVDGPGGIGGTSGATILNLWLDGGKGITTSGGFVTEWADQSGHGITATPQNAANQPGYSATLNSQPLLTFDGTDDYLQLSSNLNTTTPTVVIVANKAAASSGYRTMLTLTNTLLLARTPSTNQWGGFYNGDVLSGTTLNTTYKILTTNVRNFNDIDFFTNGTGVTVATGTGYTGKSVGTIGSNNNNAVNTGFQFFNGNIAEVIVYSSNLNSAEQIILGNALAAKYGLTLNANDLYTGDNIGFDFDVAGIGRIDASNQHLDAKGNIVRISNATAMGNNEGLLWGHDNGSLTAINTTDVPAGIEGRLGRVWRANEVGEVGNIDMQFDLSSLGAPITASDLRLLIDDDDDGIFNEGSTIIVSGATGLSCDNVIFNAVSALNNNMRFTIGTINLTQTPLPVELVDFSGACEDGKAHLTWVTASELNNDFFTIERSIDGENFEAFGKIQGAGTTSSKHTYSVDDYPPVGRIYYRLSQVDFNEDKTFLKTIYVDNNHAEEILRVSPNPIRIGDPLLVSIVNSQGAERRNIAISVLDLFGRSVPIEVSKKQNGQYEVRVRPGISSGLYLVRTFDSFSLKTSYARVYMYY